jgi:tetrahydromethanopterin S-methyltransferase subunit G
MNYQKQNNYYNIHETRLSLLEQSITTINATLVRLENKMDEVFRIINHRMDGVENKIDKRVDNIENKIDRLESRMWQLILITYSSVFGFIAAKIFHWI